MVGGIIPEEDVDSLKQMGVHAVFGPGTSTEDIVTFIQKNVRDS
jgi:methylmalonyl-CoA mutase C-terminal domain/subunit